MTPPKPLALALLLWATSTKALQLGSDGRQHFIGYAVFRLVPTSDEELKVLKSLARSSENQLDFWTHPAAVNQPVDVMVPPERILGLEQILISHMIPRSVIINDVERYVVKERLGIETSPTTLYDRASNTYFSSYRYLSQVHDFLDSLAENNPSIAETFSIGKSSEHRDLKVIKIGKSSNSTKQSIWIDGGIHAREWIASATVSYLASRLVEDYDIDPEAKELVDSFDWYILPVANPDGYMYSHSVNRMWRKTRAPTESVWGCRGVDPNRNWGFHWNEGGASSSPCHETYAGPIPFSEPETKAMSDFIFKHRKNMVAYLAVHSYSQLWLTPWGWTSDLPKDYADMIEVAKEATDAIKNVHGTAYRIGSSTRVLYEATGGADDWAHGVAEIKYAYTVELRDTGRYGFLLPKEQIIPTGEETWAGIKAMAKAIKRKL